MIIQVCDVCGRQSKECEKMLLPKRICVQQKRVPGTGRREDGLVFVPPDAYKKVGMDVCDECMRKIADFIEGLRKNETGE